MRFAVVAWGPGGVTGRHDIHQSACIAKGDAELDCPIHVDAPFDRDRFTTEEPIQFFALQFEYSADFAFYLGWLIILDNGAGEVDIVGISSHGWASPGSWSLFQGRLFIL